MNTPELLARKFPPLGRYYPNLGSVSAKQAAFLLLDQREAFYGGAVGGGKSDALLAAALQYVDMPKYAALILRRTFAQLDLPGGIMSRSKEWLTDTDAVWNEDKKRWTFPSGASLTFGHMEHASDRFRYLGSEVHFIGWDEVVEFDEETYTFLFTRTRAVKELSDRGLPIRHRSASNPGGIGHQWVKRRFVDPATREDRKFVRATIRDNPGLDIDTYLETLSHLPEDLRQMYVDGDWDAILGAAFLISADHVVDDFVLDDSTDRFEAMDYGFNGAPWALWAVDYEGNLVAVDLGYWQDKLPSEICPDIVERRKRTWGLTNIVYADPSLWKRTGGKNRWGQPAMLNDEFSDHGCPLRQANNDPRAGLTRLRELLKLDPDHVFPSWHPRASEKGSPRMFLVRGACGALIDELRAAPLQPAHKRDGGEMIDPEWEGPHGHAVAMARYAVMSKPDPSTEREKPLRELLLEPEQHSPADLRRDRLKRHLERLERPVRRALSHDY